MREMARPLIFSDGVLVRSTYTHGVRTIRFQ